MAYDNLYSYNRLLSNMEKLNGSLETMTTVCGNCHNIIKSTRSCKYFCDLFLFQVIFKQKYIYIYIIYINSIYTQLEQNNQLLANLCK